MLLLVFALKAYPKTPDPNAPPPKWVAALDSVTSTKALLVGTVVILTNPTTLALYVSGLKEIVAANLGVVGSVVVLALFVALVEIEFLAPIALYIAVPRRRAKALLGAAQRWLERHNRGVMIVVFGIFGVLLVAKGTSGLL